MIKALYKLTVTTPKGEKLLLNFIDDNLRFDAHLYATKKECTTDYYENTTGYEIIRTIDSAENFINSFC